MTINDLLNNLVNLDGVVEIKTWNGEEYNNIYSGTICGSPEEARNKDIKYIYAEVNKLVIEIE